MLWTQDVVHFKGEFHDLDGVGLNPLPVQRPIPIWMGGWKEPVLRRAARMADGLCVPLRPIPEIKQMVVDAGRDPEAFGLTGGVSLTREGVDGAVTAARAQAERGLTHVGVSTEGMGASVDVHIEALTAFRAAWRP
jgi:alkanesulfonate monooxygenase SsuD/methylene tetrahydromethanopterin reductase-like flavin-dependent oxidoreductase (luciferase family)